MSEYIINESRFVIDISDELKDHALESGTVLPNLTIVGDQIDRSDSFQIYDTQDGSFNLLVVKKALALKWLENGFIPKKALYFYTNDQGDELVIIFSPSSLILQRVNTLRAYGSLRYALSLSAAMFRTRSLEHDISLRDGIFLELYGVVLPCYTKTRAVADRALFANVLSKDQSEDLSSKEELGSAHGLNRLSLKEELYKVKISLPNVEPYLEVGELVDDFVHKGAGLTVSSYVLLDENYQIYATSDDSFILLMENSFASSLIERGLLSQIDLGNVSFGGIYLKALCLSNHFALEKVNDRHFGLTQSGAFKFALAVRRTRQLCPDARLDNALYSEELGLLLPSSYDGNGTSDAQLVREVVSVGPFANAPFLEEIIESAVKIVE